MALVPIDPKRPGEYLDTQTGAIKKFKEQREEDIYDSVTFASSTITAGTKLDVFKDTTGKSLQHSNVGQSKRIPAHSLLDLSRIGVHVRQAVGNAITTGKDCLRLYENASIVVKLTDKIISQGPLVRYQSGWGVVGGGTENNTPYVTLGVASHAAAPRLMEPQIVTTEDDINCEVKVEEANNSSWLTSTYANPVLDARNVVTTILHGVLTKSANT